MRDGQRFKALFFDFDETLVPEYESAEEAICELSTEINRLHSLNSDLRPLLYSTAARLINETPLGPATTRALGPESVRWAAKEMVWDDKRPISELGGLLGDFRRQVWSDAFAIAGIADTELAHELAERLPVMTHERRVPYHDAETVLSALGQRHPMAILTNGFPTIQAHKVENSGLKHHFEHVILCDEHGAKPDPEPFRVALDLLGCRPEEVAMVGNSLTTDMAGAHNAGIYSVWVNRGGQSQPGSDEAQPNATVQHLSELLDLL